MMMIDRSKNSTPPDKVFWPDRRAEDLRRQFARLNEQERISYSFSPSTETDTLQYFPAGICEELERQQASRFMHARIDGEDGRQPDLVIASSHGTDIVSQLWELRERIPEHAIVIGWLWDNHLAWWDNLRVALSCDIVYPSHWFCSAYLHTPATLVGGHVPACTAQWTGQSADLLMAKYGYGMRRNRVLANYVDYGGFARSELLARIGRDVPEVELLLMPSKDRSRYFSMSPEQRFAEWSAYKAALIVPLMNDLSTRVFDALLAGVVPVVPRDVGDFDSVISPEVQNEIGIVRFETYESSEVGEASRTALQLYDSMGPEGVRARHRYARENHMITNRVALILDHVSRIASGELTISFDNGPFGPALYQSF